MTMAIAHNESINWHASLTVYKFHEDKALAATAAIGHAPSLAELLSAGWTPDDVLYVDNNLMTTVGLTRWTSLLTGGGGQAFDNTHGIIGVGTSSTAATVADTALGSNGTANAWYRPLDATYPTVSAGVISANATFGATEANFAWGEWAGGISNSSSPTAATTLASTGTSPIIFNHKIQTMGSKNNPAIWGAMATLTIS